MIQSRPPPPQKLKLDDRLLNNKQILERNGFEKSTFTAYVTLISSDILKKAHIENILYGKSNHEKFTLGRGGFKA